MTSRNDFLFWAAMGLLLGMVLALQLVTTADIRDPAGWVNKYQALIGAIIAVLAAVLTVGSTLWISEARRRERLQAARAMLPFALTKLSRYSLLTIHSLKDILPNSEESQHLADNEKCFESEQLPEAAFTAVANVLELASLEVSRELSEILSRSQYFNSRLEEVDHNSKLRFSTSIFTHTILSSIVDHLELHARVARCFAYGRFISETIPQGPITLSEMKSAAHMAKLFDHSLLDDLVKARVDREFKKWKNKEFEVEVPTSSAPDTP